MSQDPFELHSPDVAALLDFERDTPRDERKDQAIRTRLGITPARYWQLLHQAIDTPEAHHHDPELVARLHRRRDAARTTRNRRIQP
ncbi:MAG TPA: DUF3263 domain-containing protein [Gryllotalpicola sp.]